MGKYEEALERAKEWEREHPNGYVIRDMMEFIFPGYNESEDEQARQFLLAVADNNLDVLHSLKTETYIGSKGLRMVADDIKGWENARAWLEKQKEQHPAEWSEEDETCLEYALWYVTKTRCCVAKDACDLDACRCAERWLESLRDRIALSHWKPSEEQMDCLQGAIEEAESEGLHGLQQGLIDLMESLKKL